VIGYRTDELPGFFSATTGLRLDTRVNEVSEIVSVFREHRALGRTQSLLVVQAPPAAHALPQADVAAAVDEAQAEARRAGITGAKVTPYLLEAVTRLTKGTSLTANLALLEQNAALAGSIATMCSEAGTG
jgi:pseudouridylate synthase